MPNNRKLLEIVEQTSRPRWELEEERIDPSRNTFEWRVFSCRKKPNQRLFRRDSVNGVITTRPRDWKKKEKEKQETNFSVVLFWLVC